MNENETSEPEAVEIKAPSLFQVIHIAPADGVSTYLFASDLEFSGQWNLNNYDDFPTELLDPFKQICQHMELNFEPGNPGEMLTISEVALHEIPHFLFKQPEVPSDD